MFLGIDVGTSALKIALVDRRQRVVAGCDMPLSLTQSRPLWSEDDPQAWWAAAQQGLDRLAQEHASAFARVQGIGMSGQMHGAVLLDAEDRPFCRRTETQPS